MEQPLIKRWSDAERWLRAEARDCTTHGKLPASAAIAFHDGCVSVLMETPVFTVEDAEDITDELCRFLPQVRADQLLITFPGCYIAEDGSELWVLKAHLGDRPRGWRTILYPLPFGEPDLHVEPVELDDRHNPWSRRIFGLFDLPVPATSDMALVTPSDPRFPVAFAPDGRYGESEQLFSIN